MQIAGQDAELPEIRLRVRLFGVFVGIAFLGVSARLFYLQVLEGDQYHAKTTNRVVRTVVLPATRGQIRDRKGRVLATTVPSFDVHVVPAQLSPEGYARLQAAFGAEVDRLPPYEALAESGRKARGQAIVAAQDVSRDVMAALETALDLTGVKVVAVPRRQYPMGSLAAHALGYLNEITAEELRTRKDDGYRAGEQIGRTGLERQWEPYLRGRKGFEKLVVDRRGVRRSDVNTADLIEGPLRQDPVPGNNIVLSLDADLQRLTERAMRGVRAAAAVVIDVHTGRVLAAASKPAFDPTLMSGRLSADRQAMITNDRLHPFRDRVTSDTYNPGSTFKAVSAIAALEEKLVTPEDTVRCGGFVEVGKRRFRCTKTHGPVSLQTALVQSCNVYFYDLGARPGMMNRLARFANELGLGAPSGLGLNAEQAGFVPTEEWHRALAAKNPQHEGFVIGHALNTAIGEGATRVTVLQMGLLYAAIANGGKLWLPQIVERVEGADGNVIEQFPPRARRDVSVSVETLAAVKRGLFGVVQDSRGTAYKARSQAIEVAGKTGTAQVVRVTRRRDDDPPRPYEQVDHAWFAGFAPAARPSVAVVVLVEHGGAGGEVAAPIAVEIVDGYFDSVASPAEREAPRLGRAGLAASPERPGRRP